MLHYRFMMSLLGFTLWKPSVAQTGMVSIWAHRPIKTTLITITRGGDKLVA